MEQKQRKTGTIKEPDVLSVSRDIKTMNIRELCKEMVEDLLNLCWQSEIN